MFSDITINTMIRQPSKDLLVHPADQIIKEEDNEEEKDEEPIDELNMDEDSALEFYNEKNYIKVLDKIF